MDQQTIDRYEIDATEREEILDILNQYFEKETGSKEKADEMMAKLATLLQNPAAKLVHIGRCVFLVMVNSPGVVEVHTMAADEQSSKLAKNFVELSRYLQAIGVKQAYSYADDPRFEAVARRTRLPLTKTKMKGSDGKMYTVFMQEFK